MRIIALETSGTAGSVAALDDDSLLCERRLAPEQRSAKFLAPTLAEVLRGVAWRPHDVQLLAVTLGPGSFTGLRIGVTTAKTFAYAVQAEVLGVNTLEVIARQAPPAVSRLSVVIDAHRQELFVGEFARDAGGAWQWLSEPALLSIEAWLANLPPGITVAGPGLDKLAGQIQARSASECVKPEPTHSLALRACMHAAALAREVSEPTAASVGRLALAHYRAGRRDDLWKLAPLYLRRSAAEEKLEAR